MPLFVYPLSIYPERVPTLIRNTGSAADKVSEPWVLFLVPQHLVSLKSQLTIKVEVYWRPLDVNC